MTKARDLANGATALSAVSPTELGYLDGVTSAVQTQINTKATYPTQTGNSGKYLTTDGTSTSWGTVSYGTWTTYTPTNSGLTIGNGTQTARYTRIGKTVTVSYKLLFGSTTSLSGNPLLIGLPSTANSIAIGSAILTDTGSTNYTGLSPVDAGSSQMRVRPLNSDATWTKYDNEITSTYPYTWTTNDVIQISITYEEQ